MFIKLTYWNGYVVGDSTLNFLFGTFIMQKQKIVLETSILAAHGGNLLYCRLKIDILTTY